jgi:hypothetical protein
MKLTIMIVMYNVGAMYMAERPYFARCHFFQEHGNDRVSKTNDG